MVLKLLTAAAAATLALAACQAAPDQAESASATAARNIVPVTIRSAGGAHIFESEIVSTTATQARGMMFRTSFAANSGMLFAPYPPSGPPREASFWMENTPLPLDIIFIRPDGTIARIAEDTVPFSRDSIPSGEPVSAVLEINAGRAAALGIVEGDRVSWPGQLK